MTDAAMDELIKETMRATLLRAAEIVLGIPDEALDAARAGVMAHGRSLSDAASVTMQQVAASTLRVAAGRIK